MRGKALINQVLFGSHCSVITELDVVFFGTDVVGTDVVGVTVDADRKHGVVLHHVYDFNETGHKFGFDVELVEIKFDVLNNPAAFIIYRGADRSVRTLVHIIGYPIAITVSNHLDDLLLDPYQEYIGNPEGRNVPALTKRFKKIDANGAAKLSLEELKAAAR